MNLLTKAIVEKLLKSPLGNHDGEERPEVIVKFFNPTGAGNVAPLKGEGCGKYSAVWSLECRNTSPGQSPNRRAAGSPFL